MFVRRELNPRGKLKANEKKTFTFVCCFECTSAVCDCAHPGEEMPSFIFLVLQANHLLALGQAGSQRARRGHLQGPPFGLAWGRVHEGLSWVGIVRLAHSMLETL